MSITTTTSYNENLVLAKAELRQFALRKMEWIKILAEKLKEIGCPSNMISSKLAKDLKGYISKPMIRKTLTSEYKDSSQVRTTRRTRLL